MKNTLLVAVLILLVLANLMGCAPAATPTATKLPVTDTALPATATSTAVPTSTPNAGPWQVIQHLQYAQSIYQAGFIDDSYGIMVGYSGSVFYTIDGGQNWSQANNNNSWCRYGLDIVDRQTAWSCGNGGVVRFSTDGGKNWQGAANFGDNEPNHCRLLSFLDARTGWAATPKLLGATTDGGATWKALALPNDIKEITTIALRTATEGYLLDTTGSLFVTTDGSQTWTTRSLGLTDKEKLTIAYAPTAAIRFTDAQNGMVVFALKDGVFSAHTADGGKTWKREPVGITYQASTLYLAHDGLTLTAIDGLSDLTVLRYQEP